MAQLGLPLGHARTHGGRREGAGRPRLLRPKGLPHLSRGFHEKTHPVHVTWRVIRGLPSLRKRALAVAIGCTFRENTAGNLRRRSGFQVIHFSIQPDHLHLIVEAADRRRLAAGLRGLGVWIARRVNEKLGLKGRVLKDRYHERRLATPREVRNAILYVLQNFKKHDPSPFVFDAWSSAPWFDGWTFTLDPPPTRTPVAPPTTWLARTGWRRHGRLGPDERPN
jgi:putative transposase